MHRCSALLTLLALVVAAHAQQIIDLKSFNGGDTKIVAVAPYAIYVSASSDPSDILEKVFVKTSDNEMKSLFDLKNYNMYQESGLLAPFVVETEARVSTELTDESMSSLEGFMYITTEEQLRDSEGFFVYDVTVSETIKLEGGENHTLVFLNSFTDITPWPSTTIHSWQQAEESAVFVYEGIPKDTTEKRNSQIFSNPVHTITGYKFIPHVETFSLNLAAFHVKTFGGVQFAIEPSGSDIDESRTTALTTTGLYMKPANAIDADFTVYTIRDARFNSSTGANVVGSVSGNAAVSLWGNGVGRNSASAVIPRDQIQELSTVVMGHQFVISWNGTTAGRFFVQYYVIQDNPVSSTMLPGRQTTGRRTSEIEATSKSSDTFQFFASILAPLLVALLL